MIGSVSYGVGLEIHPTRYANVYQFGPIQKVGVAFPDRASAERMLRVTTVKRVGLLRVKYKPEFAALVKAHGGWTSDAEREWAARRAAQK
jgi:hypothetical protein